MDGLEQGLKELLTSRGAALVGFADLRDVPAEVRQGLQFGVSFAVALDPAVISGLAGGPTKSYYAEYTRVNGWLARLAGEAAAFLTAAGYRAVAAKPTVTNAELEAGGLGTPLPHKTVATRAGLGWIGKCALLVTPQYGSAVRLGTVLTDAPLTAGRPVDRSQCGACRACVEACPASAVAGMNWEKDLRREEYYDAFACRKKARSLAAGQGIDETICGICIASCPWTRRYLARVSAAGG